MKKNAGTTKEKDESTSYPLPEETIHMGPGPHPNSTWAPLAPYQADKSKVLYWDYPDFPPTVFHRIRPPVNASEIGKMIASNSVSRLDPKLASKFKLGDGLVLAYGDGYEPGRVEALGIVTGISAVGDRQVAWTPVRFELKLSSKSGGQFWRQAKPTFKFESLVAEDMALAQEFKSRCNNPFQDL